MLQVESLSVFPEMFGPLSQSILGRAQEKGLWSFKAHDLRDWTHDKHRSVDDEPYGGGQGMLMKCAPVFEALDELCAADKPAAKIIFFTPTGQRFTQSLAQELSGEERLIFVCGRYEGFDERVYSLADYCISLGDYVLTGGEFAAMVVTDAIVRLLPGALGNEQSSEDESFSGSGLLEYEQYTRPAEYRGLKVPEVLLSGNHQAVDAWRRRNSLERTLKRRPDLIGKLDLRPEEQAFVDEFLAKTNGDYDV